MKALNCTAGGTEKQNIPVILQQILKNLKSCQVVSHLLYFSYRRPGTHVNANPGRNR